MLFSDKIVADYINKNFEPVWQSLRPVPVLTMDFRNGHVIKRTLHGNTATYICLADGRIVDVLPAIYGPRTYNYCLTLLCEKANRIAVLPPQEQLIQLSEYHNRERERVDHANWTSSMTQVIGIKSTPQNVQDEPEMRKLDRDFFASVMRDNVFNETIGRPFIHKLLSSRTRAFQPKDIQNQLFKEVHGIDLDDPYLGLGNTLRARFPGEKPE